jgi:hypothetical protein
MNDAISEMSGIAPVVSASRLPINSRISVYTSGDDVTAEQSRQWQSAPQSPRNLSVQSIAAGIVGTWRVVVIFGGLLMAIPVMFVTAPAIITLSQILLGCGLAIATWIIVKYPTEKAQVSKSSLLIDKTLTLNLVFSN